MGPMKIAEAETCETPSETFKGRCSSKKQCAAVCEKEGFPGGVCGGPGHFCLCTKPFQYREGDNVLRSGDLRRDGYGNPPQMGGEYKGKLNGYPDKKMKPDRTAHFVSP
ncbi:hypothetical protein HAX54_042846 [Datura stramonium]|uniref:Knottins-like domain-containing protein n=1 Tax=Datura stramonium TaxID=4076 RepID=A0ABS8W4K8_DATST|nr:hypothetical protein [Datura stramonium]